MEKKALVIVVLVIHAIIYPVVIISLSFTLFPAVAPAASWRSSTSSSANQVVISDNGNYWAVRGSSYLKVYSKASSTPLWTVSESYSDIAISGNGLYLACAGAGYDDDLHYYSITSSVPLWTTSSSSDEYSDVAISTDGTKVVAVGEDYYTPYYSFVKYFSTATALIGSNPTASWTDEIGTYTINDVDMSSDGSKIVAGYYDDVLMYNGTGGGLGPQYSDYTSGTINHVAISPDGAYYAAGGSYDIVYLYSSLSGNDPDWSHDTVYDIDAIDIAGNSTGGYYIGAISNNIYYYSHLSSTPLWTSYDLSSGDISLSDDGYYIAAADDGEFFLYDRPRTGSTYLYNFPTGTVDSYDSAYCAISGDGKYIAAHVEDDYDYYLYWFDKSSPSITESVDNTFVFGGVIAGMVIGNVIILAIAASIIKKKQISKVQKITRTFDGTIQKTKSTLDAAFEALKLKELQKAINFFEKSNTDFKTVATNAKTLATSPHSRKKTGLDKQMFDLKVQMRTAILVHKALSYMKAKKGSQASEYIMKALDMARDFNMMDKGRIITNSMIDN